MGLLLTIFFLVVLFLFLIPTIILSLISTILSWFGVSRKKRENVAHDGEKRVDYTQNSTGSKKGKKTKRGKLFEKNEGEYVDFEEIK